MSGDFFDSNVLLYLIADDLAKAERSLSLMADGGIISVQVLNEFAHVALRKKGRSWRSIHEVLNVIRDLLIVQPTTIDTHDKGLALAERYRLSVWDAMIVASALEARCDRLWSEDMQGGQVIDGRLRITNPFRAG